MTKKELINKVISLGKSPYAESDRAHLETMAEDKLSALVSAFTALEAGTGTGTPSPTPTPPANPPTPPTPPTPTPVKTEEADKDKGKTEEAPKTEEEYLASAPESLRSMFAKYKAEDKARRDTLIAALGKNKSVSAEYTEDQLKSMSTDDLERIDRLVAAAAGTTSVPSPTPSYLGRGIAVPPATTPTVRPCPDTWGLRAAEEKAKAAAQGQASN